MTPIFTEPIFFYLSGMPGHRKAIFVERYSISSTCVAAAVSYQGRQPYMEDRVKVITNIDNSDISIYSVFDGHAGEFAAVYGCEVIAPGISDKISVILKRIQQKTTKVVIEKTDDEVEIEVEDPLAALDDYITADCHVDYAKLLYDEILNFDAILIDRMGKKSK